MQIHRVAAGELPQATARGWLDGSTESCGEQHGGFVGRKRLQVEPLELATGPYFLHAHGDRFTVAHRQHHLRGASLDDLVQNECGELVEKVHIVDPDNHRRAFWCGS